MSRGVAECDDFRVGRGIVIAEDAVLAPADDFALMHEDGSDGDFARSLRIASLCNGSPEEIEIGLCDVRHLSGAGTRCVSAFACRDALAYSGYRVERMM